MLLIIFVPPDSKVAAGENHSRQRKTGTEWRERCQGILLFLVNLCTQGLSTFEEKQSKNLFSTAFD
jgi:hypothetical protein